VTIAKALRLRASHGTETIPDLRKATPAGFRGLPVIAESPCATGCTTCRDVCPTGAIALDPFELDLGKCVFCAECVPACPLGKVTFTSDPRMASATREGLVLREGSFLGPVEVSAALRKLFGRSLRLRQVSAGGCNACELELNATANVNFDLQRYGIEWVASPRHADGLVLTGPSSRHMAEAVRLAWDAMPEPRFLVAFGACTISGGPYTDAPAVDRAFLDEIGPALYVPGCPPHPLTFATAILDLLGVP
jgi:Ni,Fe-hydrogenase III small subunit/ferredoxin